VTAASVVLFGKPIWDPVQLIGMFHQPVVAFVALIAVLVATLNVNIGANVVSPSNDFSNLWPRVISFRTGGLITGFLGIAMCPWKLLATPDAYIFGWLVGYSGLLGPVAGIMVCDYFFIRGTKLDVNSLYRENGAYLYNKKTRGLTWPAGFVFAAIVFEMNKEFFVLNPWRLLLLIAVFLAGSLVWIRGVNPRAILALALGVGTALIGVFVKPLHFLYDYAWFVGFFLAGASYVAMMKLAAPAGVAEGAQEVA